MISGLDHVVVLVEEIGKGTAAYQTLLGRTPSWRTSGDGADRVLFTLDNITLELVAPGGDGAAGDRIREAIKASGDGARQHLLCDTAISQKCIAGSSAWR